MVCDGARRGHNWALVLALAALALALAAAAAAARLGAIVTGKEHDTSRRVAERVIVTDEL